MTFVTTTLRSKMVAVVMLGAMVVSAGLTPAVAFADGKGPSYGVDAVSFGGNYTGSASVPTYNYSNSVPVYNYSNSVKTPVYNYSNSVKTPVYNYSNSVKTPVYNYSSGYKPSYNYKYDYKPYTYSYKPYTYSYPSYNYSYPSYYGGSSGLSLTYNENDNSNSNVNNNVITVGGGETVRTVYVYDHDDDDNDDLWCDLEVSPSRIDDGEEADLIWDVRGATYASINQGIGRVDEDGGREEVDPSRDTTYRLTVRNNDGDEETCSATLRVDDDRNTFSSTVFTDEPAQNPPQVVYLSSLPYTGLDDISPAVLTYWFLLIAAIGGAFWYALSKGLIGRPRYAFAEVDGIPEVPVVETPDTSDFVTAVEEGNEEAALDALREAAVAGVGVEEYLREARLQVSDATLAARLDDAIVQAEQTGIRGAKQALFA